MKSESISNQNIASQLKRIFLSLPRSVQRKSFLYFCSQLVANLLDLLGLVLIGLLLALSISGIQSREPGNTVSRALEVLRIEELSLPWQAIILGTMSIVFFLSKTLFSIWLSRRTLRMLSISSANLSTEYADRLLNSGHLQIARSSVQKYQYEILGGMNALVIEGLGGSLAFLVDATLLFLIFSSLIWLDPLVALVATIIFSLVGVILYSIMGSRLKKIGEESTRLSIKTSQDIQQSIEVYKEISLRGTRGIFIQRINQSRMGLANLSWKTAFFPTVSKYVFESVVIISAVLMAGLVFILKDAVHAASTLTIFMTAASRIAPAAMRLQQNAVMVKNSLGRGMDSLDTLEMLRSRQNTQDQETTRLVTHSQEGIRVNNVTLSYADNQANPAVNSVSIQIPKGNFVALVGPTGSGKSTIMNLIGGFLEPTHGSITIEGLSPSEFVRAFPGAIGYVPQNISVINGSIYENVALGIPLSGSSQESCIDALRKAQLWDFVETLEHGVDENLIGPKGGLSGGQLQRLGIARALFTQPRIILLDEATSALDATTEVLVSREIIHNLKGTTLIVIAHRLSTVKEADEVIYLENGILKGSGTFEDVRSQIPNFEAQAKLLGL